MKQIIFLTLLLQTALFSKQLEVKANTFMADEKAGYSIFEGDVQLKKGYDELNATKVTIYVDKKRTPIKFVAQGDVSFRLQTEKGEKYTGSAGKVVYLPKQKEYNFYTNVHLKQLGDTKEIMGDEIKLNTLENKASAKGDGSQPVIMIFDLKEDKLND